MMRSLRKRLSIPRRIAGRQQIVEEYPDSLSSKAKIRLAELEKSH
jgi:hypothetical protein